MSYRATTLLLTMSLSTVAQAQLVGAERETFSEGAFKTCFQKLERDTPARPAVTRGYFCFCYVNDLADHVSPNEFQAMAELLTAGKVEATQAKMAPFTRAGNLKCAAILR